MRPLLPSFFSAWVRASVKPGICWGRAGTVIRTLQRTCGNDSMSVASSDNGFLFLIMMARSCRAASVPSPVVLCSRKIRCPDCSPPKEKPPLRIVSTTYRSPTWQRIRRPSIFCMASSSPMLLITVATNVFLRSLRLSSRSCAQMAMMWSPSTILPRSSQTMSRSASPSRASPILAPSCTTCAAICSGCKAPQF